MKIVITILLWVAAFCATAQNTEKNLDLPSFEGDFIMMRSYEAFTLMSSSSKLVISNGKGTEWSTGLGSGIRIKEMEANLSTIVAVLQKIKEQGYLLIDVSSQTLFEGSILIKDYLFEKKAP